MEPKEGGAFVLFNGMIAGTFVKLDPPREIMMKWRMKSYPSNHYATVQITLKDTGSATEMKVCVERVGFMRKCSLCLDVR